MPAMRSKRMVHPAIGAITLDCLVLSSDEHTQVLLVYTAQPGTEDHQRLELLSVVGRQELAAQPALDDDARG